MKIKSIWLGRIFWFTMIISCWSTESLASTTTLNKTSSEIVKITYDSNFNSTLFVMTPNNDSLILAENPHCIQLSAMPLVGSQAVCSYVLQEGKIYRFFKDNDQNSYVDFSLQQGQVLATAHGLLSVSQTDGKWVIVDNSLSQELRD